MKTCLITAVLLATTAACYAYPEPAVVQGRDQWTLDVRFEHLRQINLVPAGEEKPKRFWYIILTVTNNTGAEVDFYPYCELMTDRYELIGAGKNVTADVFRRIKKRHQTKYPFLQPLEKVDNQLLRGPDYTKDIAVIFPDFDPEVNNVKVFISGLSNETAAVEYPVSEDGLPRRVVLTKTLQLEYLLGGSPKKRSQAGLEFKGKSWIMRQIPRS